MNLASKQLFSEADIRQLESLSIKNGISADTLMQHAATAAFKVFYDHFENAKSLVIFCGNGNNGGDGYAFAKLAHEQGLECSVRYVGDLEKLKPEAQNARQACIEAGVNIKPFDKDEPFYVDVFVDALLGIGLQGEVRSPFDEAIAFINAHEPITSVLSLDIPSGLCAQTGSVLGTSVHADCTITFIGLKQGLVTGQAPDYCGEIVLNTLEIPQEILEIVKPCARIIDLGHFLPLLKTRPRTAHKGYFGHVLVVGGDLGMSGAPRMAALSAARAGAGLVTVATHPDNAKLMNMMQPELMSFGVELRLDLFPLLEKATVVVIGLGFGQTKWSRQLFSMTLEYNLPLIVDADALNALAKQPFKRADWILTPHPGEAGRLLGVSTKAIQADRYEAAKTIAKRYGGVCILKGAGTVIADENEHISVCVDGNPGMASGGMGDLLSGIIAGLIAQGMPLEIAACFGVCLHAKAGDLAAQKWGERGLLATDLLGFVRALINQKDLCLHEAF